MAFSRKHFRAMRSIVRDANAKSTTLARKVHIARKLLLMTSDELERRQAFINFSGRLLQLIGTGIECGRQHIGCRGILEA